MFLNETKPPPGAALVHYGVLGMRWGKRKRSSKSTKSKVALGAAQVAVALHKFGATEYALAAAGAGAFKVLSSADADTIDTQVRLLRSGANALRSIESKIWNTPIDDATAD